MSMKAILEKLSPKDFIRVHRSYIVNIHRIEYVQRMEIRIGNKDIPIGENFRDPFFNAINQNQQPT
jgi:DNA-binding LytR/AlgR family response regulator